MCGRVAAGLCRPHLSAAIAVFVVVAAVATTVQVVRIGHSGAESAWSDALDAGTTAEPASGG